MRRILPHFALLALLACGENSTEPVDTIVEARLSVNPVQGTILTDFVFDAGDSQAESRALEYRWDFDEDGEWDTDWSSQSSVTRRFESAETTVRVEARSGNGSDETGISVTLDLDHGEQVGEVRLLDNIVPRDLTWDGSQFWILGSIGSGGANIYRVSLDGQISTTHDTPLSLTKGIAFDGSHLWLTDNPPAGEQTLLFKIDPATGLNLWSFEVAYSNQPAGLTYRNGAFYHGSTEGNTAGDDRIHKYDEAGDELAVFDMPEGAGTPRGLAYDGENLWVFGYDSDTLYVVNGETGTELRSLEIDGHLHKPVIVNGYLWLPFTEDFEGSDTLFLKKFVP